MASIPRWCSPDWEMIDLLGIGLMGRVLTINWVMWERMEFGGEPLATYRGKVAEGYTYRTRITLERGCANCSAIPRDHRVVLISRGGSQNRKFETNLGSFHCFHCIIATQTLDFHTGKWLFFRIKIRRGLLAVRISGRIRTHSVTHSRGALPASIMGSWCHNAEHTPAAHKNKEN